MATVEQMVATLQVGVKLNAALLDLEGEFEPILAFTDGSGKTQIGLYESLMGESKYTAVEEIAERLRDEGAINALILRQVEVSTPETDASLRTRLQMLSVDLNGEVVSWTAPISRAGYAPTVGPWKRSKPGKEIRGRMIDPIVEAIRDSADGEALEGEIVDE